MNSSKFSAARREPSVGISFCNLRFVTTFILPQLRAWASFFSAEPARKSTLPKLPDPGPDACFSPPTASESNRGMAFAAHQRVRVNLAGLMIQGVTFHAAVTDALATIVRKTTEEPPAYLVDLLFSFKGLKQIEVPEERIRPA